MLYFLINTLGKLIDVRAESPGRDTLIRTRHDLKNFEDANFLAIDASKLTGRLHLATDAGEYTWPRYDVIAAPVVGALVSKSFNGDSYHAGTIAKISASFKRVETDTGVVFFRRKLSGAWVNHGTWAMIPGHVSEQNPSF